MSDEYRAVYIIKTWHPDDRSTNICKLDKFHDYASRSKFHLLKPFFKKWIKNPDTRKQIKLQSMKSSGNSYAAATHERFAFSALSAQGWRYLEPWSEHTNDHGNHHSALSNYLSNARVDVSNDKRLIAAQFLVDVLQGESSTLIASPRVAYATVRSLLRDDDARRITTLGTRSHPARAASEGLRRKPLIESNWPSRRDATRCAHVPPTLQPGNSVADWRRFAHTSSSPSPSPSSSSSTATLYSCRVAPSRCARLVCLPKRNCVLSIKISHLQVGV